MPDVNSAKPDGWYASIFSRIYDPFMENFELKVLQKRRKLLLSELKGNILEVGAGSGANFSNYGAEAKVLAIEPSASMLRLAEQRLLDEPCAAEIGLLLAGIGDDIIWKSAPDGGFDAVVFTLVLCTIPDPEKALKQCIAYLKPGGKILVLEHIAAKSSFGLTVQKIINPVWQHLAEGCQLDRHTDELLHASGLKLINEEYFTKGVPLYMSVWQKD